jgi:hypothetical protein
MKKVSIMLQVRSNSISSEEFQMSRPGHEANEMLETIETRLKAALDVVGSRWTAMNAGGPSTSEDLVYCEGFLDALRVLLGPDQESTEIIDDLATQWAASTHGAGPEDLEATDGAAA